MAWRVSAYLIEGELDNTQPGKVTGWMRFAGMKEKVTLNLQGDFHRDIRGAKIHFTGDAYETDPPADAESYMDGLSPEQTGKVGDITAGLSPVDYVNYPYIEWYSDDNGRVVVELEPVQVEVIGRPIPACESDPISREQQSRNMAEFLGGIATEMNLPAEHAVCISGKTIIQANKEAANGKIRGMKLLTKEIRRKLPPLYSQESKGGKAIVHLKLFTPDGSWSWYITEGSARRDPDGKAVDYLLYGLVEGQRRQLDYFWLSDLETLRSPTGLPVVRDLHWQAKMLLEIAPQMFKTSHKQMED